MFWRRKKEKQTEVEIDIFFLLNELQGAADAEKRGGNLYHWQRYIWAIASIRHVMRQRDAALGLLEQGEIDLNRGSRKIREEYYSATFTYTEK